MQRIDLARAKLHLRVDGDEEDSLISGWIAAAYLAIEGKIFAKLYETQADIPEGAVGVVVDEAIHSAAQLIIGHLYANREAVAPGQAAEIPMGADWLLLPYINTAGVLMQAGTLKDRITIQHKTGDKDAWGTPLPDAWEDLAYVWAHVRHQSGAEAIRAGADVSTVQASVRIRWRTNITAAMRVVFMGQLYDIEAVLPHGSRQWLDLVCKRVR